MKKHIIGLALFSFIVSAAAVVYAIFNVPEIIPVYGIVSTPPYVPSERTHCKMGRPARNNSIEVRQAILDVKTGQFNLEFSTSKKNDQPINLHFFTKDERGTRYITTEGLFAEFSRNGVFRFSNIYGWMNDLKSVENLYVIARLASETENYSESYQVDDNKFQPRFDTAKATAVTIDYGK